MQASSAVLASTKSVDQENDETYKACKVTTTVEWGQGISGLSHLGTRRVDCFLMVSLEDRERGAKEGTMSDRVAGR